MNVKSKFVLVIRSLVAVAILFGLFSLNFGTTSIDAAGQAIPAPIRINGYDFDPVTEASRFADDGLVTDYQIIQFNGPITANDKQAIEAMGVELLGYVPQFAYVARMNGVDTQMVQNHPLIRWVGDYNVAYRVSPNISTARSLDANASKLLSVSLFEGSDMETFGGLLAEKGIQVVSFIEDSLGAEVIMSASMGDLDEIARFEGISWVEESATPEFMNADATVITGVTGMRSNKGLTGYYGQGQVVAVADTGFDSGSMEVGLMHRDFEDGYGNSRVIAIYDMAGDGPDDTGGHGTHVAGTVLGNGIMDGSDPANQIFDGTNAGVAPEAQLIFQAAQDKNTGGYYGLTNIETLFGQAHTNPTGEAFIHSNSWGYPTLMGRYTTTAIRVDNYVWENPEFLPVFSAGNSGGTSGAISSVISPGTAKNALTVGSSYNLGESKAIDDLASNSGRGPVLDGRVKPDIVAPGVGIYSTATTARFEQDYMRMSGTSMATPHVAGAAALVREYLGRDNHPTPSAALIKAILVNGAVDLSLTNKTLPISRPNSDMGWGRLELKESLGIDSDNSLLYWDSLAEGSDSHYVAPMETGNIETISIPGVGTTSPLRITLAWSDYQGTSAANGGLVNDLDLMVTAPDGTVFYPNNANNGGISDNFDHVNNLVGIDILRPQEGTYTVTITGFNVPQGPQPYGLAVNGTFGPNLTDSAPSGDFSIIDGHGIYVIGNSGMRIHVESQTTGTIYAKKISPLVTDPIFAAHAMNVEYELVTEGLAGEPLLAKVTAGYSQAEFDASGISNEAILTLYQVVNSNALGYDILGRDLVNNTVTVENIQLPTRSSWLFGESAPTAVSIASNQLDSNMNALILALVPIGMILLTTGLLLTRRRDF